MNTIVWGRTWLRRSRCMTGTTAVASRGGVRGDRNVDFWPISVGDEVKKLQETDIRGRTLAHSASPTIILHTPQLPPSYDQPYFLGNHTSDRIHVHKEWFVTALPEASRMWIYGCFMNNVVAKVNRIDVCNWLKGKREMEKDWMVRRHDCSSDTRVGKRQLVSQILGCILVFNSWRYYHVPESKLLRETESCSAGLEISWDGSYVCQSLLLFKAVSSQ